jgi:hypothetical protein
MANMPRSLLQKGFKFCITSARLRHTFWLQRESGGQADKQ